jgi:hypothetical protein
VTFQPDSKRHGPLKVIPLSLPKASSIELVLKISFHIGSIGLSMALGLVNQAHVSNVTISYQVDPSTMPEPWQIRLTGFILSATILLWTGVLSPIINRHKDTEKGWQQWATSVPFYIINTIRTISAFVATIRAATRSTNSALLPTTGLVMLSLASFPGTLTWPTPLNFLSYANTFLAFLAAWIVFGFGTHDTKHQYGALRLKGGQCPWVWYNEEFARDPAELRDLCVSWIQTNSSGGGCEASTNTERYLGQQYYDFTASIQNFNWTAENEQMALYIFMPVAIAIGGYLILTIWMWIVMFCTWMCSPSKFEASKGWLGRHIWKICTLLFIWTLLVGSLSVVAHIGDQNLPGWGEHQKSREDLNGEPFLPNPTIVVDGFGAEWLDCFLVDRQLDSRSYVSLWWSYVKYNAAAYLAFV